MDLYQIYCSIIAMVSILDFVYMLALSLLHLSGHESQDHSKKYLRISFYTLAHHFYNLLIAQNIFYLFSFFMIFFFISEQVEVIKSYY